MSKQYNVAVVGASGAVGNELLRVLEEREFPVGVLRLFASERSDGEFLEFRGESLLVEPLRDDSFVDAELVFFAAGDEIARKFAPKATAAGARCIDLSAAWRGAPEVPLLVPEVNPGAAARTAGSLFASPSPAAVALAVALAPLHAAVGLQRVVVTTFEAVSTAGQGAVDELRAQCGELLNGRPATAAVFPHQIAFNCLPQIGAFDGDGECAGERGLESELHRLIGTTAFKVTATAVRAPLFYGIAAALTVETARPLTAEAARVLLEVAAGCEVLDDPALCNYPQPATAAGQDSVQIGRLRADRSVEHGLSLWLCADNLRKGGATNAVQIAELLLAAE